MKEYDLNVTATETISVEAETEDEAIEKAFYAAFGRSWTSFVDTKYEVIDVKD